jgi:glutamyl-tRNA synthetase
MPDETLLAEFLSFLGHSADGQALLKKVDQGLKAKLLRAMPGLKERAKTLQELKAASTFLFEDPEPDVKAQQILQDYGVQVLKSIYPVLEANSSWTEASLEADVMHFASKHGLKLGQIAQPLRAALTGTSTSPGIFDVMAVLEKPATLRRIGKAAGLL